MKTLLGQLPDPDEFPCSYCGSAEGEPCRTPSTRKNYVDSNGPRFHAARYRSAGHRMTGRGHLIGDP